MKPLFTFLIAALFLVGCGPTGEEHAHDHSHDHDHSEETKKLEDEIASLKKAAAEKDAKIKSLEDAAKAPQGVRLGTGLMTFDTIPGWGLGEDGKSQIGPTHGGVAIGKDGTIYTSADRGVYAFSPDGKVLRSFLDE